MPKTSTNLFKKIFTMVALPCAALVVVIGYGIFQLHQQKQTADAVIRNIDTLEHISQLIGRLQVERGTSAVFIKSGRKDAKNLGKARSETDSRIATVLPELTRLGQHNNDSAKVSKLLTTIADMRKQADSDGELKAVLGYYTQGVSLLRNIQKSFAGDASATLSAKIRSYALLETARENAGLLRAHLSGALAADTPLADETFYKLLKLQSGMMVNLTSDGLVLAEASQARADSFVQKEHWQTTNHVFKEVLRLSRSGNFGYDATEFFATISKCVNDIRDLLLMEAEAIRSLAARQSEVLAREMTVTVVAFLSLLVGLLWFIRFNIKASRRAVQQITAQLGEISQELITTAEHLVATSGDLRDSVTQQTKFVESTSASTEELSAMTNNNVATASKSAQSAQTSLETVKKALDSMAELVKSMDKISAATGTVIEISQIMSEIGEETKVIDEIVFQTKLLSFNASVEAERAGEHGRGFAVVAQEVGNLAQLSGRAATSISTKISQSVSHTEKITTNNKEAVDEGASLVKLTAELLTKIKETTESITTDSSYIDSASKEQSIGINQITDALVTLDQTNKKNQDSAESNYAIGSSLAIQANQLEAAVASLHSFLAGSHKQEAAHGYGGAKHGANQQITAEPSDHGVDINHHDNVA